MIACANLDAQDAHYLQIIDKKCDIYRLLDYKDHEYSEIGRDLNLAKIFKDSSIEDYRIHFEEKRRKLYS